MRALMGDGLWMPGIADLIQRVNRGILMVGLRRQVEGNRRAKPRRPYFSGTALHACLESSLFRGFAARPPRGQMARMGAHRTGGSTLKSLQVLEEIAKTIPFKSER
jgi:hypothetical protein